MDLENIKDFSLKVEDLTKSISALHKEKKVLANANLIKVFARLPGKTYDSDFLIGDRQFIKMKNQSVSVFKTILSKELDDLIEEKEKELQTLISNGVPAENGGSK